MAKKLDNKVKITRVLVPDIRTDYINVTPFKCYFDIIVTTKAKIGKPKPIASTKMDRLKDSASAVLDNYEKIITDEVMRLDRKVAALVAKGDKDAQKKAEKMVAETTLSVKNALASVHAAAEDAVEARRKKESKGDKLLLESDIRTGIKIVSGVISLAKDIGALVLTAGTDVAAYIGIASTLKELIPIFTNLAKDEDAKKKDLKKAINAWIKLRQTTIRKAMEDNGLDDIAKMVDLSNPKESIKTIFASLKSAKVQLTEGKSAKQVGTDVLAYIKKKIKSDTKEPEAARKRYRDFITRTRHGIDKMGKTLDKLVAAMKKARNLKDGVKLGAEVMKAKRTMKHLNPELMKKEDWLAGMETLMKSQNLEIDDRTIIDKLKELDKATIKDDLTELKGIADNIKDLVDVIKDLAK